MLAVGDYSGACDTGAGGAEVLVAIVVLGAAKSERNAKAEGVIRSAGAANTAAAD